MDDIATFGQCPRDAPRGPGVAGTVTRKNVLERKVGNSLVHYVPRVVCLGLGHIKNLLCIPSCCFIGLKFRAGARDCHIATASLEYTIAIQNKYN